MILVKAGGSSSSFRDPPSKTEVKAIWPPRHNIVRYAEMKTLERERNFSLHINASKMFARRKSALRVPGDALNN